MNQWFQAYPYHQQALHVTWHLTTASFYESEHNWCRVETGSWSIIKENHQEGKETGRGNRAAQGTKSRRLVPEVTKVKMSGSGVIFTPTVNVNATACCSPHLVKAATTAHSSSLVLAFMLSPSGSSSSSCRTLFMARSYWSSNKGAKAFSRTSEEWAKKMRARSRLSIRWGSFTHLSSTASCTFLMRRCLMLLLVRGCVVMSNSKKFCFSVVRTPFSTRFLASRSRTFLSW